MVAWPLFEKYGHAFDAFKLSITSIGTESVPIKIRLVAPPLYVMVSNATDKQGAIELLETAIERIGEPKAVSETDDLELAALMERVARENKEVSGDEDSDAD
ncbi:hypothetical protein H4Q26_010204 [Puccinia striiformis f. sp. tritici PST-130]|nr:hypothetical protein H4Q26_010204 [Puccinia striiformis f. sp. tritici PST-130]